MACCLAIEAAGQPPPTASDLPQIDEDFPFQGEYFGPVSRQAFGTDHVGLQVVALGNQEFTAVLLHGGLPGGGWDRKTKASLSGQRDGGQLLLEGEGYHVAVYPREAVVEAPHGTATARLTKINRVSRTQGAAPPWNASVLFDGRSTRQLENGKITSEGLLDVGALTKLKVGDFHLHAEFRTPYMPRGRGQGRGNSGIYIQQRYEVQVLDSFGLEGVENECGSLYRQKRPDVNMCLPPLSWQTYDIYFRAARWNAAGEKTAHARITVLHNGEPVQSNYEIVAKTGAGQPEAPTRLPILFQNHRDPVRFRNIWIVAAAPTRVVADNSLTSWRTLLTTRSESLGNCCPLPPRCYIRR